jgi:hypothetical protein
MTIRPRTGSGGLNIGQAQNMLALGVSEAISTSLKALLETKHLYQSVQVDLVPAFENAAKQLFEPMNLGALMQFRDIDLGVDWTPSEKQVFAMIQGVPQHAAPTLLVQNVKLHCKPSSVPAFCFLAPVSY